MTNAIKGRLNLTPPVGGGGGGKGYAVVAKSNELSGLEFTIADGEVGLASYISSGSDASLVLNQLVAGDWVPYTWNDRNGIDDQMNSNPSLWWTMSIGYLPPGTYQVVSGSYQSAFTVAVLPMGAVLTNYGS